MKKSHKYLLMLKTVFPNLTKSFRTVIDHRDSRKIIYKQSTLLWFGLLTFIFKCGSRRTFPQLFLENEIGISNFYKIAKEKQFDRLPHHDTVANALEKIQPSELERIGVELTQTLIRRKTFDKYRFMSEYFLIAIDGTQQTTFKEKHCPYCLETRHVRKDSEDKEISFMRYHHNILTARIVFASGITLPICREFIENQPDEENAPFKKQDCELKAAYRLLKRLKAYFPQLKICLLGDNIYLNKNIISICEQNGWNYFLSLKEGGAPGLYESHEVQKKMCPDKCLVKEIADVKQTYYWNNKLNFTSGSVNVIECFEEARKKKTRFMYATNFLADSGNIEKLINNGGRQRIKIENEVFNEEKNGGYNLTHLYSEDPNANKNYIYLLTIAHTLNQLYEKGILSKDEQKKFNRKIITVTFLMYFCSVLFIESDESINFHFDTG